MKKKMGKREAFRIAVENIAAIVEASDLEEVFSDQIPDRQDALADWAQREVVRRIRKMNERRAR